MTQVQIIQVTPEQLNQVVQDAVKIQLEEFKKSFEPKATEQFLSRKEAAEFMRIGITTLWRRCLDGKIPYHKNGSTVYFKKSELEASLKLVKK